MITAEAVAKIYWTLTQVQVHVRHFTRMAFISLAFLWASVLPSVKGDYFPRWRISRLPSGFLLLALRKLLTDQWVVFDLSGWTEWPSSGALGLSPHDLHHNPPLLINVKVGTPSWKGFSLGLSHAVCCYCPSFSSSSSFFFFSSFFIEHTRCTRYCSEHYEYQRQNQVEWMR